MKNYLKWIKKTGGKKNENSLVGWINADEFVTGLKAAGPNFTRQKVVDATNAITNYTAGGIVAADRLDDRPPEGRRVLRGREGGQRRRSSRCTARRASRSCASRATLKKMPDEAHRSAPERTRDVDRVPRSRTGAR